MGNIAISAILCCVALWLPSSAQAEYEAGFTQIKEKPQKSNLPIHLSDKNGQIYEFGERYLLRQGLSSYHFYIASLAMPNHSLSVYDGEAFGDAGTCPSKKEKEQITLEKASLSRTYTINDVNGDGFNDVVFTAEEKNCTTGQHRTVKRIFYATEHGFAAEASREKNSSNEN